MMNAELRVILNSRSGRSKRLSSVVEISVLQSLLAQKLCVEQALLGTTFMTEMTLDKLAPGQTADVVRVAGGDSIAARLREMGFVPGEAVRLLRLAPLGDPIKCMIHGSRVAIRCREAQRVIVNIAMQ